MRDTHAGLGAGYSRTGLRSTAISEALLFLRKNLQLPLQKDNRQKRLCTLYLFFECFLSLCVQTPFFFQTSVVKHVESTTRKQPIYRNESYIMIRFFRYGNNAPWQVVCRCHSWPFFSTILALDWRFAPSLYNWISKVTPHIPKEKKKQHGERPDLSLTWRNSVVLLNIQLSSVVHFYKFSS